MSSTEKGQQGCRLYRKTEFCLLGSSGKGVCLFAHFLRRGRTQPPARPSCAISLVRMRSRCGCDRCRKCERTGEGIIEPMKMLSTVPHSKTTLTAICEHESAHWSCTSLLEEETSMASISYRVAVLCWTTAMNVPCRSEHPIRVGDDH